MQLLAANYLRKAQPMTLQYIITRIFTILTFVSTSALSQTPVGRSIPGRFIVTYRNGAIPSNASPRAQSAGAQLLRRHELLGIAILQSTPAAAARTRAALAADPNVQYVVEDRVVSAHNLIVRHSSAPASDADALYNSPQGWAVRQVGGYAPGPWSVTTGAGIRIAMLDSGVDANHPDLAPNLALNISEVDQSPATGLPSTCDDGSPQDQQGHGSWTASLAAAAAGPGTGLVAGVAPSASILNIKVLERMPSAAGDCASGQASGLLSWVLAGIEDAVSSHADIISLSLGTLVDITTGDGAGIQATFDQVTHAAANAGVVLIASAGNDGYNLTNQRYVELPAQSRDVLAVIASTNPACAENLAANAVCTRGSITVPYYSNYGAPLNALAAPGGSYPAGPNSDINQPSGWIWGACSDGISSTTSGPPSTPGQSFGCFALGHTAYVQAMGTSASAPLAAGAAALLIAANPTWSAATVVAALRAAAVSIPTLPVAQISIVSLITPPPQVDPQSPLKIVSPRR
jgi:subtilisin family serine protease